MRRRLVPRVLTSYHNMRLLLLLRLLLRLLLLCLHPRVQPRLLKLLELCVQRIVAWHRRLLQELHRSRVIRHCRGVRLLRIGSRLPNRRLPNRRQLVVHVRTLGRRRHVAWLRRLRSGSAGWTPTLCSIADNSRLLGAASRATGPLGGRSRRLRRWP